jgi:hypothetical protein
MGMMPTIGEASGMLAPRGGGERLACRALIAAFLIVLTVAAWVPARAADPLGQSYLTPFPENDLYRVYVFADGFGAGLGEALASLLDDETAIEMVDRSEGSAGIGRNDGITWDEVIDQMSGAEQINAAVVLFGVSDRQAIRVDRKRYNLGTPEWRDEYKKRVDRVMKALKREGAAIYWLGLPVMRSPAAAEAAEQMNSIFREMAVINAVKYIDTWSGFTDSSGAYSPYGPDLTGRVRELRSGDGVYFTGRGYQKLAHFAEQEIRRDVALARAERDVPLAGAEDEQAQIAAERKRAAAAQAAASGKLAAGEGRLEERSDAPVAAVLDYAADDSAITVPDGSGGKLRLEIPRPRIPGAVVAHILRSSQARSIDIGETVGTDLKIGLTALSSIASSLGRRSGTGQVGVTQSPYYKLLVKGESLPPKPGRADDFHWPRQAGGTRQPGS